MATKRDVRKTVGAARIVAETPVSDGSTARIIENFNLTEQGALDSTFRKMRLIPDAWRGAAQPAPFLRGVLGMVATRFWGNRPKVLFLTNGSSASGGVWELTPNTRDLGGTQPGLTEVFGYNGSTATRVYPQGTQRFPAQLETVGDRVIFVFGDGGGTWVWDGERVRTFGFTQIPAAPGSDGPQRDGTATLNNNGGFSVSGRIGTTEGSWTDATNLTVGGIDEGSWNYGVVLESIDGGYSAMSPLSAPCIISIMLATPPVTSVEALRKRFHLRDIPIGPKDSCRARILTRTPNTRRLPPGSFGEPQFLKRIPHNHECEWVDDCPDGELGPVWKNRMAWPTGVLFLKAAFGSLFVATEDRVYWTEQEDAGPVFESIMDGHWARVAPHLGGNRGMFPGWVGDSRTPALLVGKQHGMAFLVGKYPDWQSGVLHPAAPLAGPALIQASPDGSIIWFGARTFWQFKQDGTVTDIGGFIRETLGTVDMFQAHMGCSWVDQASGEVVFALPVVDRTSPATLEFIWDYQNQGWRFRHAQSARCACVAGSEVLVAGVFDATDTVWVQNRGYPGSWSTTPTAKYRTGWCAFGESSPDMHLPTNLNEAVVTQEERGNFDVGIDSRIDWDQDEAQTAGATFPSTNEDHRADIAYYGSAVYGTSLWRQRRATSVRRALHGDSHTTFAIDVFTTYPVSLFSIDAFGTVVGGAGTRTPE